MTFGRRSQLVSRAVRFRLLPMTTRCCGVASDRYEDHESLNQRRSRGVLANDEERPPITRGLSCFGEFVGELSDKRSRRPPESPAGCQQWRISAALPPIPEICSDSSCRKTTSTHRILYYVQPLITVQCGVALHESTTTFIPNCRAIGVRRYVDGVSTATWIHRHNVCDDVRRQRSAVSSRDG